MPKTVTFAWAGREYQLPVLLARTAISFFGKQKEFEKASQSGDTETLISMCLDIMETLGLPSEVLNELTLDEVQPCMMALIDAVMPKPKETSGHPFEETTTTPSSPGSSSATTPGSSVAG